MNRPLHVALVCQTFPPSVNPEAHVTAKLVHSMLEAGTRVTVLTTDQWGVAHERLPARLEHRFLTVLRVRYPKGWGRIPKHLVCAARTLAPVGPAYFVHAGLRLFRTAGSAPDVVYARGLPSHGYFVGARLAKQYQVPLLVHFSDPWPKRQWPPPYSSRPDLAERWEDAASGTVLQQTSAFTCPSRRLLRYMADRFPEIRSRPTCVLPHTVPPWDISDASAPTRGNGQDGTELLYTGSVHQGRDPQPFLAGLRRFLDERPRAIRLRMIGTESPMLDRAIRVLHLEGDVERTPTLEYLDTLAEMRRAGALLLLEAAMPEGIFLPSKLPDYCWAGRPLLALSPDIGEVADYLRKVNIEVIPPNSGPERIARALGHLLEENAPLASALCAEFEGKAVCQKLLDLVREVVST